MTAPEQTPTMRYDHLVEQYLTHLADSSSPRTVRTYTGILRRAQAETPHGIVAATEQEIRDWLWVPGRSGKTIETYLAALRSLHRWLLQREITDYDPTRLLPHPHISRRLPKPTTDAETARLVALPQPWGLYMLLLAYTGARCIELARLDREHVDEQAVLLDGKGARQRRVPTHPLVWEAVADLPPGPVCHQRNERSLARQLRTHMGRAGVAGGPHRLRHWYATRVLDSCADLRVVQELLATTQVYTRVNVGRLAGAVAGLPALSRGPAAAGRADQAAPPAGRPS